MNRLFEQVKMEQHFHELHAKFGDDMDQLVSAAYKQFRARIEETQRREEEVRKRIQNERSKRHG